ncbi:MAG: OmpA family protein [Leptolyngbyaceae cyanobacterium RM2_2_4]|nr:OmpA family protein [Leptolyngbyaceae cyanobacterium RM2_2_4]
MLDLRQIREKTEQIQERLNLRGGYDLNPILELDQQQRELEGRRSQLQARSNEIGKLVGQKMKSGADPKSEEIQALRDEGNQVKAQLSELEPQERDLKAQLEALLLTLPNLPSDSTPVGKSEDENVEIRRWGDEYLPQNPDILPHWEIGEKLKILNFERSTKVAQSRFVTLIGAGAALERALIQFMLDNEQVRGEISGHTDNVGDAQANVELSLKRAKSVYEYLQNNGIAANRLVFKGYGQSQAAVPNDSEENRHRNRRIEFKIL